MLFSSIPFLYYFLPLILIIYHIVPKKAKNGALLLASLLFYAWGEPRYVFLMIALILTGYFCGLGIERYRGKRSAKLILIFSVVISAAALLLFKYADFLIEIAGTLTGCKLQPLKLALPVGISFYTFQLLSYTVDVYRGTVCAQKSFIDLAAYVTMFPQLIAGPIVRYADIEKQLKERKQDARKLLDGISRFVIGLSKKILISNALGELCSTFRASDEKSVLFFWIYALSFTLQIYFDFSGYSDMAIGLGKLFGFEFMENFRYPYLSKSITEFWRRWHISLGTWFRDYVYIPLGGNRVSKGKWYRNIFLVWALTGLWHGAAMNFLLWGLLFAALLIVEKRWLLKKLEKAKLWNHLYVLFWVILSFVIFNASGISGAAEDLAGMFGLGNVPLTSGKTIYYLKSYGVTLGMAILGATPWLKKASESLSGFQTGRRVQGVLKPVLLILLFLVSTAYLIDGSFNPFLYFRF